MQFNQKLIKDLKDGRVILHNEPKNPEVLMNVLKESFPSCRKTATGCACFYYRDTTGIKKWVSRGEKCYNLPDLPKIPISDFLLPENGTITESQTFCGSEKQFEIGKCYEFSDDNEEWSKGKLLAIVDHRDKYVVGFEDVVFGFEFIRPIQPKEVTRWINMSKSGNQVGKKCFESEMEACQHAPQSQNVFQVKLTGTYKI